MPQGPVSKMLSYYEPGSGKAVSYHLALGDETIPLNDYLGKTICFEFVGKISCHHCKAPIKRTFHQGYCYPCFQRLAECDRCIMRPELCHFDQGTCRDEKWAATHCQIKHTVYLANASGLKVGITRSHQSLTRWIDQGAVQAIPMRYLDNRYQSGLCEEEYRNYVSDRTQWQTMLKGAIPPLDLFRERAALEEKIKSTLPGAVSQEAMVEIQYPVAEYPKKVKSHNLDKKPLLEGTLHGIKGQYLILDVAVINIRKYQGYHLNWKTAL